jgi:(p)ppGpp synthase/HD superfamily hydrolase
MNWFKAYIHAIEMAAIAHNGINRKFSAEPYLVHPLRVSEIVLEHTGNFELGCAAVLHDVLEDSDLIKIQDIKNSFTPYVAVLVESVTKKKDLPKAEREVEYLTRFKTSGNDTILIKLADRLDNVKDLLNTNIPLHFRLSYTRNTAALLKAIPEYAFLDSRVGRLRSLINETLEKGEENCRCGEKGRFGERCPVHG